MREGHDGSIEVFGGAIFFQLLEIFYVRLSGPALVTCTFYVAFGVQKREFGKCLMANSHHPPSSIFYLFFRSGIFDYLFPPFFLFAFFYMFTTPSKFSFHISSCEFVETTQRLSARDRPASKVRTYMSTRSKAASKLMSRLSVGVILRLFPHALCLSFTHDWPLKWIDNVHLNVSTMSMKGIIFGCDLGNFARHNIANSNGNFVRKMPSPWVVSFFFFCFCISSVVWSTRPSKAFKVFTSRMKLTAADKFVFEIVSMEPFFSVSLIHRTNFCTLSPECAMLFVVPAFLQLWAQIFFFRRQAVRERVDLSI